eukprot:CFRG3270T1
MWSFVDCATYAFISSLAGVVGFLANVTYQELTWHLSSARTLARKTTGDHPTDLSTASQISREIKFGGNKTKLGRSNDKVQPSRTSSSNLSRQKFVGVYDVLKRREFWRKVSASCVRISLRKTTGKTAIQRTSRSLEASLVRVKKSLVVNPQVLEFDKEVSGKDYIHHNTTVKALHALGEEIRDGDHNFFGVYEHVTNGEEYNVDVMVSEIETADGVKYDDATKILVRDYLVGLAWVTNVAANVESERWKVVSNDGSDEASVAMLLEGIWKSLLPAEEYPGRIGKHWSKLGFQGKDPVTDLRAMGHLGLSSIIFFALTYPSWARSTITRSNHPKYWYPFAITLINITSFVYKLMQDGLLNTTLLSLMEKGKLDLPKPPKGCDPFFEICCYVADVFDREWSKARPANVMEHPSIMKLTETKIRDVINGTGVALPMLPVRMFTRGLE